MAVTDLANAAREAFAAGYALTGAPVTDRARAGSAAAVALAHERAHDPGILEATLDLGHLEGTWAVVYARRDRLLARHLRAVLAAWNDLVKPLDARQLARAFRSAAYITSETVSPDVKFWRDTGITAALAWLRAILHADGYPALVAALEDAIRAGMAEGEADALALAASRQGKTGFRIADAFAAAYERLAGDPSISQQAHDAAAALTDAAAGDVGRRLASLAGDDGGEDDMTAGVAGVMDAGQATERGTDWALWAGIGLGAKALYSRVADAIGGMLGGLVEVDWVTASDGKVCVTCQGNEDDGPYSPDDLPAYPAHPRCRCSTQSRTRFPLSFLAPYLP